MYQDYLNRLRKLDGKVHHTPAGTVGPLERGFSEITANATDFKGWVVGFKFYGEQSKALAGVANLNIIQVADAQTAKHLASQVLVVRERTDRPATGVAASGEQGPYGP